MTQDPRRVGSNAANDLEPNRIDRAKWRRVEVTIGIAWATIGVALALFIHLGTGQAVLGLGCLAYVIYRYTFVADLVLDFITRNYLLTGLILLIYGLMCGATASTYGIMNLFWHEDAATRFFAAMFLTLFFGLIFILLFYADPCKWETWISTGYYRNGPTAPVADNQGESTAPDDAVSPLGAPAWLDRFGGPVARALDTLQNVPRRLRGEFVPQSNSSPVRLQKRRPPIQAFLKRSLDTFFFPFWCLLLLPAIVPDLFPYLPRSLPTELLGWSIPWPQSMLYVDSSAAAWGVGLLLWALGSFLGCFVLWAYVEVNRRLYGVASDPDTRPHLVAALFDRIMDRIIGPDRRPATDRGATEAEIQYAIQRYVFTVVGVYLLTILANMLATWRHWSELSIRVGTLLGLALLLTAFGLVIFFVRELVRAGAGVDKSIPATGRFDVFGAVLMGFGIALIGLRSAVFPLLLVLGVVAILMVVITRFTDTWNWPLKSLPLKLVIPAVLVVYAACSNSAPLKLPIPGLEQVDPAKHPIQTIFPALGATDTDDLDVLKAWRSNAVEALAKIPGNVVPKDKIYPKLVLVTTSGGANRAAFWTAAVLEQLATAPEFGPQLRLISGASGGMVGAAFHVAGLVDETRTTPAFDRIPLDSLSPVVRQGLLGDLPTLFWPLPYKGAWDRGVALEQAWPDLYETTFGRLSKLESLGKIPSLVFSPMLVEDGRQLLISNLTLDFMCAARGSVISDGVDDLFSVPAVPMSKLFVKEFPSFRLSTAARLNASFPYVSPGATLPATPYRRAVDAGYYDNYGINVAASWIFHHREWIRDNTSGVVVIQILAYPMHELRVNITAPPPSLLTPVFRAFEFVSTPVEGGTSSRYASTLFRNDQVLDALTKWFNVDQKKPDFFETVVFENGLDVSMNWYTTKPERDILRSSLNPKVNIEDLPLPSRGGDEAKRRSELIRGNRDKMEKLKDWLKVKQHP